MTTDRSRRAAVISLSLELTVTAEDMAKLDPEQIKALFEGAGHIAAVKASLGE